MAHPSNPWHTASRLRRVDAVRSGAREPDDNLESFDRLMRALIRAVAAGGGLPQLAAAAAAHLECTVTLVSRHGEVYAISGSSIVDAAKESAFMVELEQQGAFASFAAVPRPSMFEAPTIRHFGRRLGCPVMVAGDWAGMAWLDTPTSTASDSQHFRAIEHVANLAAVILTHHQDVGTIAARVGDGVIRNLLEGTFESTPFALERAAALGWDEKATYRICLVLLDEPLPLLPGGQRKREELHERFARCLRDLRCSPLIATALNQIKFLCPEAIAPDDVWNVIANSNCAMAVSRRHAGVTGMAAGMQDAVALVPFLRPSRIHHFDDDLFPRALLGDPGARACFVERTLLPLAEQKRGPVLLETLLVLADEGFHLANSAKALGIHITSLRQRIEHIEAILHVSLSDPGARFRLQVASAFHRLQ